MWGFLEGGLDVYLRTLSMALMVALLAACTANVQIQANGNLKADKGEKVAKPVKSASPSASPSADAPAPAATTSAAPVSLIAPSAAPEITNPFGLPTAVRPPLPASVISTGGGNLIGQAGGNLIGQAGGNLIGQAGGNLIGQAGGNYMLLQAAPPLPSVSEMLPKVMDYYLFATTMLEAVLSRPDIKKLTPGKVHVIVKPEIPALLGQDVHVLLEVRADHALLSLGLNGDPKGEKQFASIRFTSATKGTGVFRGLMMPLAPYMAAEFDLEKGLGRAQLVRNTGNGDILAANYEVMRNKVADAKGVVCTVKVSRATYVPKTPGDSGYLLVAANVMADDSAAVVFAVQDQVTGDQPLFIPTDGIVRSDMPNKPHDFYMDKDGKDLPSSGASEALKAIVPEMADLYRPFPDMPVATYDKTTDPRFVFPK